MLLVVSCSILNNWIFSSLFSGKTMDLTLEEIADFKITTIPMVNNW